MVANSLQESPAVAALYHRKLFTGHKLVFYGKDVKNSLRVLPCEDCIARVAGKKLLLLACIDTCPVIMLPYQLSVMALSMRRRNQF